MIWREFNDTPRLHNEFTLRLPATVKDQRRVPPPRTKTEHSPAIFTHQESTTPEEVCESRRATLQYSIHSGGAGGVLGVEKLMWLGKAVLSERTEEKRVREFFPEVEEL